MSHDEVQETPVQETPVQETPVQETPVQETPVQETPVQETPVQETPAQETPAQKAPAQPINISSTKAPWLEHIEKLIEEDKENSPEPEEDFLVIVRDLLLAPDDDDNAVPAAIEAFKEFYLEGSIWENVESREPPEYGAGGFLNSIANAVFEGVDRVPFTTPRHDRLANFLIGIKASADTEYKKDNPSLVWFDWGFGLAASETWNACHADGFKRGTDEEWTIHSKAWVNSSALIAKLFQAGFLEKDAPGWMAFDMNKAFVTRTEGGSEFATNIGRKSQVLATANNILIAGEALARELKSSRKHRLLDTENWKFWASKFQEVANAAGEESEEVGWNLKASAQEAHDKMIALYPELFKEELSEKSENA
ncbi:hypothetical protein B0T10DRAFT_315059 [Thelonectria olida]|uniref:Uncharacterized protein n=1 Tax=Thelonectria olida TaxID=1576542 RepID=A0A9P9APT1_9HYPO|nr:hypothetical protein B0T10DRAFT_315059 [Thelonectria olida]